MAAKVSKRWRVEFVRLLCNPDGSREARSVRREWVWPVSAAQAESTCRRRTGLDSRAHDVGNGVIEWYDADVLEVASAD